MNPENFHEALNFIDDDLLEETNRIRSNPPKKNNSGRLRYISAVLAAAFTVVTAMSVIVWQLSASASNLTPEGTAPTENGIVKLNRSKPEETKSTVSALSEKATDGAEANDNSANSSANGSAGNRGDVAPTGNSRPGLITAEILHMTNIGFSALVDDVESGALSDEQLSQLRGSDTVMVIAGDDGSYALTDGMRIELTIGEAEYNPDTNSFYIYPASLFPVDDSAEDCDTDDNISDRENNSVNDADAVETRNGHSPVGESTRDEPFKDMTDGCEK